MLENYSKLFKLKLDSFKTYLDSCYFQTKQMESINLIKLAEDQEDIQEFTSCTILDADFYKKFDINIQNQTKDQENNEKSKANDHVLIQWCQNWVPFMNIRQKKVNLKRVNLRAIELDWIFKGERSTSFLKELSETDNMEVFELDIIKDIIMFQWKYFSRAIMLKLFMPFMIYFVLFCVYTTYILERQYDAQETNNDYDMASYIIGSIILLFCVFWSYVELRQIKLSGCEYFKSFWNYLDSFSIIMN